MQNTNETDRGKLGSLNHPSREEWMSYLYSELPRSTRTALHEHLRHCASCRDNVRDWRQVMQSLDRWKLPAIRRSIPLPEPFFKWAVAALFLLGVGFGIGRFVSRTTDLAGLRTELASSLRASLAKELRETLRADTKDDFPNLLAAARQNLDNDLNSLAHRTLAAADSRSQQLLSAYDEQARTQFDTFAAQLNNLRLRQNSLAAEFANLRKDAETVALLTEDNFRRTQQQMYRLASFSTTDGGLPEPGPTKP